MTAGIPPKLKTLPSTLPVEGAVRIELQEGVPIFRASSRVQDRIQDLLDKQQISPLSPEEERELDGWEEIDDYISFVNRMIGNLLLAESQQDL